MSQQHLTPSKSTMKAVLWEGKPNHMVTREVPKPRICYPTDALVRLTTAAICGSDLHTFHGLLGGIDLPNIMGHEGIGIVIEVGDKVKNFKIGDRVVIPDGNFGSATGGLDGAQDPIGGYGFSELPGGFLNLGGLQAEIARVPDADNFLNLLPAGFQNELDYVLLSDIFPTAWSSITSTGFQPGDTVTVYGAGPVGLLAAYSALFRGARKVYSIDHVDARLEKARSIGAIPIDLRLGDPADQIMQLEPKGVDRASDCCGLECVNTELKPQQNFIINNAVKVVRAGGGIAITGVYWEGQRSQSEPNQRPDFGHIEFDIATWWFKGITIAGGPVSSLGLIPELRDLITAGRVHPSFVFEKVVGLDEVPKAYKVFSDHKVEKVAVDFTGRHRGSVDAEGAVVNGHADGNGGRHMRKRARAD